MKNVNMKLNVAVGYTECVHLMFELEKIVR